MLRIAEFIGNPAKQHAFVFGPGTQKGESQPALIGKADDARPEIERFQLALKLDADNGIGLDRLGNVDNAASAEAEVHGVRAGMGAANRLKNPNAPGDGISRRSASFAEGSVVVWGVTTRVRGHL